MKQMILNQLGRAGESAFLIVGSSASHKTGASRAAPKMKVMIQVRRNQTLMLTRIKNLILAMLRDLMLKRNKNLVLAILPHLMLTRNKNLILAILHHLMLVYVS